MSILEITVTGAWKQNSVSIEKLTLEEYVVKWYCQGTQIKCMMFQILLKYSQYGFVSAQVTDLVKRKSR